MLFENPALPIPENSKAKHPTLILNPDFKEKTHTDGSGGSHSVFGSPALPIPENPKAEHPTPVSRASFYVILTLLGSLDHESTGLTKATSETLKIKQARGHSLCQGDKRFATYCRQVTGRGKQDDQGDQPCRKPPQSTNAS